MSHNVHPKIFRIKKIEDWSSQWFNKKKYRYNLEQDYNIRKLIKTNLKQAGIDEAIIKRSANSIQIIIKAARPGIIIGRGGTGIQDFKKELIRKVFKNKIKGIDIKLDVEEVKRSEMQASIVAQVVAEQLERRMPFRRVIKQTLQKLIQNPDVKGAKISISGRLNGADMARTEHLEKGKLPLQTIRANIDYAHANANTTYGIIGVKIWIYKGEVFE